MSTEQAGGPVRANPRVAWTVDHVGLTVPDADEAAAFFVCVLGATELYRASMPVGTDPEAMERNLNAHRDAGYRMIKLALGGMALELFDYQAPDLSYVVPRNCDAGGQHLALAVPSMSDALRRLKECDNVRILGRPSRIAPPHPLAGRRWVYFVTPWGQHLELVCDEYRRHRP